MAVGRAYTPLTLEERYTATPQSRQFAQELERGLRPRDPDTLFDMVGALGLGPTSRLLDGGCGTCWAACRLAGCTPARILAIDPVPSLLAATRETVQMAGMGGRIAILRGSIMALPLASGSVDLVWSSDMLGDGFPIPPAIRECYRVLRPGGGMLVYKTFAGELLEPREAERLYRALGSGSPAEERMDFAELAFRDAGFRIERKDVIACEWREYRLEHDERSPRLGLDASRLLRRRDYFVQKYGEARYE